MGTGRRLAEHLAQGLETRSCEPNVALPVAFQPTPAAGLRHDRGGDEGQHLRRCGVETDGKAVGTRMRHGIGTFASQETQGLARVDGGWRHPFG